MEFSVRGTLLATAAALVEVGPEGYFVAELDNLLHVSTQDALRKLVVQTRLSREKLAGQFLYCAGQARQRDQQLRARGLRLAEPGAAGPLPEKLIMPDELRAAIVLFFSLLDEQQRRLYAGLEALKTGRGGDGRIAELLGVDVGTVARGRRELLAQDVAADRVRRAGGGRPPLEKKLRKLSRATDSLIVDECHHLSARSFEQVARRSKARFVLGLSATVARKDGHQPIIFMQCGPVRYRVDAKAQAERRGFEHRVQVRATDFQLPTLLQGLDRVPIPQLFAVLAADEARNALIFDDVLAALEAGRYPLVLTERRDHLEALRARFEKFAKNVVVLRGGMGSRERRAAAEILRVPEPEERLVLSTGRFLGEGFDDSRLDTLFLVSPISWKGTLAQYVGRLHREHQGKAEVRVYDYVDANVPVLARMAARRRAGYKALGYID
jgi:superfamily II DNA or RNA helicase